MLWWYCFDDQIAQWLNMPALGHLPLGLWFLIMFLSFATQIGTFLLGIGR